MMYVVVFANHHRFELHCPAGVVGLYSVDIHGNGTQWNEYPGHPGNTLNHAYGLLSTHTYTTRHTHVTHSGDQCDGGDRALHHARL
jgi:hypothetical protein